jgi:hypothetical protein
MLACISASCYSAAACTARRCWVRQLAGSTLGATVAPLQGLAVRCSCRGSCDLALCHSNYKTPETRCICLILLQATHTIRITAMTHTGSPSTVRIAFGRNQSIAGHLGSEISRVPVYVERCCLSHTLVRSLHVKCKDYSNTRDHKHCDTAAA